MANKNPNTAGLKPFPKGVSGNPGGRPKKRPITDEYFAISQKSIPDKLRKKFEKKWQMDLEKGITFAEMNAVSRALAALEAEGAKDSKEMREAMEGKAPMRLEIQGTEHRQVTLELIFRKRINQSSKD